jgi:hypothetical protein
LPSAQTEAIQIIDRAWVSALRETGGWVWGGGGQRDQNSLSRLSPKIISIFFFQTYRYNF